MKVYLKNAIGQQTIRDLRVSTILRILWYQWTRVPKNERCIIKIIF